jgi:CheY-like chemotaxis protein
MVQDSRSTSLASWPASEPGQRLRHLALQLSRGAGGRGLSAAAVWLAPSPSGSGTDRIVGRWADVAVVRVLLVDDQAAFRRAMISGQETPGFQIVGAEASGEESVRLAEALLPDLLLTDFNLPGIDGLVATRRLRENADHPPVLFLLSTQDEHVADGYAA